MSIKIHTRSVSLNDRSQVWVEIQHESATMAQTLVVGTSGLLSGHSLHDLTKRAAKDALKQLEDVTIEAAGRIAGLFDA